MENLKKRNHGIEKTELKNPSSPYGETKKICEEFLERLKIGLNREFDTSTGELSIFCGGSGKICYQFNLDSFKNRMIVYNSFFTKNFFTLEDFMASKDGKIFDTIVYIGLGVNALTALYLLLMYFEVI